MALDRSSSEKLLFTSDLLFISEILFIQSFAATRDDCISIVSGYKGVMVADIVCGPGHGISIGSLGADNSAAYVSNVVVDTARFVGTTNGVRLKTWQGGSGYANNIVFKNISMRNVSNPIIINQKYCDQKDPCPVQASAVKVSNVVYRNIRGTSASKVAINFDCSKTHPCTVNLGWLQWGLLNVEGYYDILLDKGVDEGFIQGSAWSVSADSPGELLSRMEEYERVATRQRWEVDPLSVSASQSGDTQNLSRSIQLNANPIQC